VARAATKLDSAIRLFLIAPPLETVPFPEAEDLRQAVQVYAGGKDHIVSVTEIRNWAQDLPLCGQVQVIPKADHLFVGQTLKLVDFLMRDMAKFRAESSL